jgi:signal transduction histidine kinase/CheY-like chemotaxis protein
VKKKGLKSKRIFLLVIFLLNVVLNIFANDTQNDTIRFAVWNKPNSAIINKDGSITGFEPEIFSQLVPFLEKDIEIIAFDDKLDCLEALRNNQVDVVMSSYYSKEIDEEFDYSNIMVRNVNLVLCSVNDYYTYQDYVSFENSKIGYVFRGESTNKSIAFVKSKIKNAEFMEYDNSKELYSALLDSEINLGIFDFGSIGNSCNIIDRLYSFPTYYITRENEYWQVSKAFSNLLNNSHDIYNSLYEDFYPRVITTEFTREELNYINSNPKLIATTALNKNVFSSVNTSGEIVGIFPDIIRDINKTSGLNIEIVTNDGHVSMGEILSNNQTDIAIGLDCLKSKVDKDNLFYINSVMKIPMELITKRGEVLDNSEVRTIAVAREGSSTYKFVKENYPSWIIVFEDNILKRYDMLLKNEVDCLIDSSYSFNYLNSNPRYQALTRYPLSIYSEDLNIVVNQNINSILAQIINKATIKLKKNTLSNIVYSNISEISYSPTLYDNFLSHRLEYLATLSLIIIFFFGLYYYSSNRRRKELEENNEELIEAEKIANEASQAKSVFLARMSHDMRTPLGAIIVLSEFGINEASIDDIKAYFLDIYDSAKYLLSLMDDILDSQRLQSENFEFDFSYVNMCNILKRVVTFVDNKAKEKNKKLEIKNNTNDFHKCIYTDEKRISQIYVNILNNAIKYTPKDGTIYWENTCEYVGSDKVKVISIIRDTGVGMSPDFVKNHLFEPFSKEKNSLSRSEGGTGLGLSICKKLIDQMHGSIVCDSVLGVGTTFTIEIVYDIVKDINIDDCIEKQYINFEAEYNNCFDGKKILVCDDTEINIKIARKILESKKIIVDVAYDGESAVKKVLSNTYDAILMDVRMPKLDGIEATKKIREFNTTIPIFAYSANAYSDDIEKSLEAGMNEHLAKPVNIKKLYYLLNKYFT